MSNPLQRSGLVREADDPRDAELDEEAEGGPLPVEPVLPGRALAPPRRFPSRLSMRIGDRFVLLRVDQIRWIEADGNNVRVHVEGGACYAQRDTLRRLEGLLDSERFLRISRGAIVNLDYVRSVERWFHGNFKLRLAGGEDLCSTAAFRANLRRLLRLEPPRA
ncbi:MAG TPA: LytTR family DNA-binding domain-containing protein [Thermoanaerobaculia bacterium]|jgi:two-component system LytT family response regulator|nr:LytTR family DNA-binding domain-containing protein [Thermoanaerobaculia bacterium]